LLQVANYQLLTAFLERNIKDTNLQKNYHASVIEGSHLSFIVLMSLK
jgi:hypothetical protein